MFPLIMRSPVRNPMINQRNSLDGVITTEKNKSVMLMSSMMMKLNYKVEYKEYWKDDMSEKNRKYAGSVN